MGNRADFTLPALPLLLSYYLFIPEQPVKIPPYALPTKKREIIIAIKIIFAVVFFIYYFIKILIILGLIQPVLFLYSIKGAVQSKSEHLYFSCRSNKSNATDADCCGTHLSVGAEHKERMKIRNSH